MSCQIHWQSSTSDLRPETWRVARELTSRTSKPRASSTSNSGIQYTPVASIATISTLSEASQSASLYKSSLNVEKQRTG